jgi:hypothetical protein
LFCLVVPRALCGLFGLQYYLIFFDCTIFDWLAVFSRLFLIGPFPIGLQYFLTFTFSYWLAVLSCLFLIGPFRIGLPNIILSLFG